MPLNKETKHEYLSENIYWTAGIFWTIIKSYVITHFIHFKDISKIILMSLGSLGGLDPRELSITRPLLNNHNSPQKNNEVHIEFCLKVIFWSVLGVCKYISLFAILLCMFLVVANKITYTALFFSLHETCFFQLHNVKIFIFNVFCYFCCTHVFVYTSKIPACHFIFIWHVNILIFSPFS